MSSQRSPKEWSYDHDRPPPLPSSPPTRKPSVLKASSSSTRKTGLGYLAFPSSGGGKTGGGGASSTGAGPSSTWLDVPSADRPPPPPRPPRPSMTKKALLKSSGHSSSSSGFSEESRPASTLPTPFTSFPTPKLEAQSRTASPLPVLEIADFGAGDFDWALDTYGSGSAGASSWTGGGVGPGEVSASSYVELWAQAGDPLPPPGPRLRLRLPSDADMLISTLYDLVGIAELLLDRFNRSPADCFCGSIPSAGKHLRPPRTLAVRGPPSRSDAPLPPPHLVCNPHTDLHPSSLLCRPQLSQALSASPSRPVPQMRVSPSPASPAEALLPLSRSLPRLYGRHLGSTSRRPTRHPSRPARRTLDRRRA